jgi:hypothetical protein
MIFPFGLRRWSFGKNPEILEISPPESGFECGSVHIGGAKSIRLNRLQSRRSVFPIQDWTVLVGVDYDDRPTLPACEMLFDLSGTRFGRRTLRCWIAP